MSKKGTTTGNVKMRSGPGMQFEPPIAFLEPKTEVEVLGQEGEWLHVRFKGKEGYIGHEYVKVEEIAASAPAPAPEKPSPSMARRAQEDKEERFGNKM
jgi:uncharacterized protein YraI